MQVVDYINVVAGIRWTPVRTPAAHGWPMLLLKADPSDVVHFERLTAFAGRGTEFMPTR